MLRKSLQIINNLRNSLTDYLSYRKSYWSLNCPLPFSLSLFAGLVNSKSRVSTRKTQPQLKAAIGTPSFNSVYSALNINISDIYSAMEPGFAEHQHENYLKLENGVWWVRGCVGAWRSFLQIRPILSWNKTILVKLTALPPSRHTE